MIVHCPNCDTTVDAKECGHNVIYEEEQIPSIQVTLLSCPLCCNSILAEQELIAVTFNEYDWSFPVRIWPDSESKLPTELPPMVRTSLDEANKCFKAKAYLACAVMCGRVIESICKDHNTKSGNLLNGLKILLEKQIIDKKIYEWADALRLHRNIGAHANEEVIIKEDARDLLDFSFAICNYVYILTLKFKSFMARKQS